MAEIFVNVQHASLLYWRA